jgi:hypothetical protein
MKKSIIILPIFLAVMLLSGCGKKQALDGNQNQNTNQGTVQNQEREQEQGGMINSIKDAMGLGKKMKCSYTMETGEGKDTYTTYVDGKKYKSESEFEGKMQYSVFDGEIIYSWNNKEKKGTKMSSKCLEDLNKSTEEDKPEKVAAPEAAEPTDENFEDAMDVKCEDVSSIDFSIPSDVVFTDQCEEMKKMMESLKQYQNQAQTQIPAGTLPEGVEMP